MLLQPITLGAAPNDGTGEGLREGGVKINANFDLVAERFLDLVHNVRDFGAVGDGVTDDYAAIQAAIEAAHAAGGGRVYVPSVDVEAGEYYRLGSKKPLYARDNVHIFGDGPSSLLFNDSTDVTPWMNTAVILFGNFSARAFQETVYRALDPIPAGGANVVTLVTPADAANYSAGDIVIIASTQHWLYSVGWQCPHESFITEVVAANDNTGEVTLRHGVPVGMTQPRIGNSAERQSGTLTASPDNFGQPYYMVKRASIQNLGMKSIRQWNGRGGMLECVWRDLWLDGTNGVYGNGFAHTLVENIWAKFRKKLIETAIGSYNTVIRNIHGEIGQAELQPGGVTWIKVGENARDIRIDATINNPEGGAVTANVARVSHATNAHINVVADAPGITNAGIVFRIGELAGDNTKATKGCTVTATLRMGTVGRFLFVQDARDGVAVDPGDPDDPDDPDEPDAPDPGDGDGAIFKDNTFRINATGTTTFAAAVVTGVGNDISGSRFSHGGLVYSAPATGLIALDAFVPDGFKNAVTPAILAANPLHRLITTKSKALAALSTTNIDGAIDVNSVTVDNVVDTFVIPAGSLSPGDELRVLAHGRILQDNGAKELRLHIAETAVDVATLSWGASAQTSFHVDARVYFRTTVGHNSHALTTQGTVVAGRSTTGTALDIDASAVTVSLRAWVANALDTVRVDRITWRVVPRGSLS